MPDGPLTSQLQKLAPGDKILVGGKPTGTLIQDNLLPGKTLYMLGTGTGLAPFVSIIKDPDTYERYEHVVLVHGCRAIAELGYGELVVNRLLEDEFFGEMVKDKLLYYPTVTREPFRNSGRMTDPAGDRQDGGRTRPAAPEPRNDRVMLCGSPDMLADLTAFLAEDRIRRRQPFRARPIRHRKGLRREVSGTPPSSHTQGGGNTDRGSRELAAPL